MKSPIVFSAVALMLAGAPVLGAPPSKEERKIETTARKVTRSVMVRHEGRKKAFVFNTDLTTCTPDTPPSFETCAPPYANILTETQSNFLLCEGGPFALCYYSGPEGTLPCGVRKAAEGRYAECKCIEVPYGPYFVVGELPQPGSRDSCATRALGIGEPGAYDTVHGRDRCRRTYEPSA